MISSMTVQVDKDLCEPKKLERMGIEVQEDGDNLLLEVMGIVDTGADVSCVSNEMREGLGRAPLKDALGKIIVIGNSQSNKEKDKLRVITCDKEITVVETRKIGELGINAHNNIQCNEVIRKD